MEGAEYVLKRKPMDGGYLIVIDLAPKARLSQAKINFIGCCIGVCNACDSTRAAHYGVNAPQKFRHDDARLPASRARDKANVTFLVYSTSLFIR